MVITETNNNPAASIMSHNVTSLHPKLWSLTPFTPLTPLTPQKNIIQLNNSQTKKLQQWAN